jgi:hypothetical protein
MFHGIRQIDIGHGQTSPGDGLAQQQAGGSHEWMPLQVFAVAGLFADEHHARAGAPFAEDGLRRVPEQRTARTISRRPADPFERTLARGQ